MLALRPRPVDAELTGTALAGAAGAVGAGSVGTSTGAAGTRAADMGSAAERRRAGWPAVGLVTVARDARLAGAADWVWADWVWADWAWADRVWADRVWADRVWADRVWADSDELTESDEVGSAWATAAVTTDPAPAKTPATATPRHSCLTCLAVSLFFPVPMLRYPLDPGSLPLRRGKDRRLDFAQNRGPPPLPRRFTADSGDVAWRQMDFIATGDIGTPAKLYSGAFLWCNRS